MRFLPTKANPEDGNASSIDLVDSSYNSFRDRDAESDWRISLVLPTPRSRYVLSETSIMHWGGFQFQQPSLGLDLAMGRRHQGSVNVELHWPRVQL